MAEQRFSNTVGLACNLAMQEAMADGSPAVEPTHLLIGICSLEKVFSPAIKRIKLSRDDLDGIGVEWSFAMSVFTDASINPVLLRRALRKPARSPQIESSASVEFSKESQSALERGASIASSQGQSSAGLLDVLLAVIEDRALRAKLADVGVSVDHLLSGGFARSQASSTIPELHSTRQTGEHSLGRVVTIGEVTFRSQKPIGNTRRFLHQAIEADLSFQKLTHLFEASWTQIRDDSPDQLVQEVLEHLLQVLPSARRGVILVADISSGELLLKAHFPPGSPVVSLSSAREAMENRKAFIWAKAARDESGAGAEEGLYAPLVWKDRVLGVICLDNGTSGTPFARDDLGLLASFGHYLGLALVSCNRWRDTQRHTTLVQRLLMNFSPNLRAHVLERAHKGRLSPGGERSEVTILFADLRGFTAATVTMDADEIAEMLNAYLSVLAESIVAYKGTIDKYIGDAVLAVFGSPDADPHQHENAIRAAKQMNAAMGKVNEKRTASNRVVCDIGIGIHCGEVFHGFIGTSERIEFTVVGEAVNRSSRYCSGAAAREILISPELYQRVWQVVETERVTITTKHEGDLLAYRLM